MGDEHSDLLQGTLELLVLKALELIDHTARACGSVRCAEGRRCLFRVYALPGPVPHGTLQAQTVDAVGRRGVAPCARGDDQCRRCKRHSWRVKRFLRPYSSEFSSEFIGLTGDTDRLRQVAAQFSAASFPAMTKDRQGRYLVDHSAQICLVDASGRLRATFFNPSVEAMVRIGTNVLE